jgi:hypothetical protein
VRDVRIRLHSELLQGLHPSPIEVTLAVEEWDAETERLISEAARGE